MGIGIGTGDNAAVTAAQAAINSPLLETSIQGARGVLLNITGGANLSLFEVNEASEIISEAADEDANIIFGSVIDETLQDEVRVTVIATGFDDHTVTVDVAGKKVDVNTDTHKIDVFKVNNIDIPTWMRKSNT